LSSRRNHFELKSNLWQILLVCLFVGQAAVARDAYETVGVSRDANDAQIQKAFKKLAFQLHPDHSPGTEAEFKELNIAYQNIRTAADRRRYSITGLSSGEGVNRAMQRPYVVNHFSNYLHAAYPKLIPDSFDPKSDEFTHVILPKILGHSEVIADILLFYPYYHLNRYFEHAGVFPIPSDEFESEHRDVYSAVIMAIHDAREKAAEKTSNEIGSRALESQAGDDRIIAALENDDQGGLESREAMSAVFQWGLVSPRIQVAVLNRVLRTDPAEGYGDDIIKTGEQMLLKWSNPYGFDRVTQASEELRSRALTRLLGDPMSRKDGRFLYYIAAAGVVADEGNINKMELLLDRFDHLPTKEIPDFIAFMKAILNSRLQSKAVASLVKYLQTETSAYQRVSAAQLILSVRPHDASAIRSLEHDLKSEPKESAIALLRDNPNHRGARTEIQSLLIYGETEDHEKIDPVRLVSRLLNSGITLNSGELELMHNLLNRSSGTEHIDLLKYIKPILAEREASLYRSANACDANFSK
jgi:curved DNA-binding protein CbpA